MHDLIYPRLFLPCEGIELRMKGKTGQRIFLERQSSQYLVEKLGFGIASD
jgi:hypothetical protein